MDATPSEDRDRDGSSLAAEERQRLLSRMLSRLAHEIRNPLSSLDVHVQLLEEDLVGLAPRVSPEITGRLEVIRHELHRLDAIVRQYLSLAAPSPADLQPVDVFAALRHIIRLLGPAAAERAITLEIAPATALPEILADAGQLQQALLNLVLNAIQAVERAGRVTITVTADADRRSLGIAVADTGPGVEPARRQAVFEPFYTTKTEGSGLGLWIAQQIAHAHGGTIGVTPGETGGAIFTLHLPFRPAVPA